MRGRLSEEPEAYGSNHSKTDAPSERGQGHADAPARGRWHRALTEHANRSAAGLRGRLCERRFLYSAMRSESGPSCASWWQRIIPTMMQVGLQNSVLTGFFGKKDENGQLF